MSTKTMLSHILFCTILNLALSVTFENVKVQFQTIYYEEYTIDVNSSSLKELPTSDIHRLTIIGDSSIPILHKDAISDLPKLKILQIRQHGLKEIEAGAFKNVPLLEIVRLSGNKLKEIKEGVFNNLNIVFLNLDHNLIEKISPRGFDNFTKLEVLDLGNNKLKEFHPQWLKDKPVLASVSLTYNEIEELPFGALEHYQKGIDFSNNRIRNISRKIFGSGKILGQLWLNDNGIESWDEDFLEGVQIGVLDMSRNQLECLDGDLGKFFVAHQTRIDGNPWDCECLQKIYQWVANSERHVIMRSSLTKCNLTSPPAA